MNMVRGILLVLVGIGAMVDGVWVYGKDPTAIEKTGWAYRSFGPNGVSVGMIVMGIVMALIGGLIVRSEWRALDRSKRP